MDEGLFFVALLAIAVVVTIAARRLAVPYTVALVAAGLVLGALHPAVAPRLTHERLYLLFLPGLIYEGALHLDTRTFLANKRMILLLAVPGTVLATVLTSAGLTFLAPLFGVHGLRPVDGLVFGALISATDPAAVIVLFNALGVPRRLNTIVEGESLLNDAAAIVLFSLASELAGGAHFTVGRGAIEFLRIVSLGALAGAAVAALVTFVARYVADTMGRGALTMVAAYGSFLVAERLHCVRRRGDARGGPDDRARRGRRRTRELRPGRGRVVVAVRRVLAELGRLPARRIPGGPARRARGTVGAGRRRLSPRHGDESRRGCRGDARRSTDLREASGRVDQSALVGGPPRTALDGPRAGLAGLAARKAPPPGHHLGRGRAVDPRPGAVDATASAPGRSPGAYGARGPAERRRDDAHRARPARLVVHQGGGAAAACARPSTAARGVSSAFGEHARRVDEREVRERLREVADQAPARSARTPRTSRPRSLRSASSRSNSASASLRRPE